MRGIVEGLAVAFIVVVLTLLLAAVAALGVALIGLLLHGWFDLTQWQGSLIALGVALGVGWAVFQVANSRETQGEPAWIELDEEHGSTAAVEPTVVPWRRQQPTQGPLPSGQRQQKGSHRK